MISISHISFNKILYVSYLTFVITLGIAIFYFSFFTIDFSLFYLYAFWIVLHAVVESKPVSLDTKDQLSLSFSINLALVMIYGPWFSIIVAALGSAITDIASKRGIIKALFNSAQYSITLWVTGAIYSIFAQPSPKEFVISQHIIPFIIAALTYVTVNFLLVSIIVSLYHQLPLLTIIKMDLGMILLFLTSLAPISLLMAILYTNEPWSIVLILPPLALAHNGFENYLKLRKQTKATIELLADVVDKRDPYTASHSFRVANFAEQIAKEMGLSYEQIKNISMAGRVHDLGKIAIRDDVLLKPGRLTDSEFKEMKAHPSIGYEILSPLKMYKEVLHFVLYHHERLDGKGYPKGVNVHSIPLGARILTVADSFDAMTTDRPYRKALSQNEAIEELLKNRGTQFDPLVVDAFVQSLENKKLNKEVIK